MGGDCAEQSVREYALRAIEDGETMLLRVVPFGGEEERGVVTVQNPCLSGGMIEVFVEPVVPAPRLLVEGDMPISQALLRLGGEFGLDTVAVVGGEFEPREGDFALVVAGHGREELPALRAGLEAALPYVGLVASRRRGQGVLGELRGDGVPAGAARPHRHARRARHRRAHAGGDRALDPGQDRRGAAGAEGGAGDGDRSRVRDDGDGRAGDALARARGRDALLLPRGVQGRLRAAACRLTSPAGSSSARAARSGWGGRSRRCRSATGRCSGTWSASRASATSISSWWRSAARPTRSASRST